MDRWMDGWMAALVRNRYASLQSALGTTSPSIVSDPQSSSDPSYHQKEEWGGRGAPNVSPKFVPRLQRARPPHPPRARPWCALSFSSHPQLPTYLPARSRAPPKHIVVVVVVNFIPTYLPTNLLPLDQDHIAVRHGILLPLRPDRPPVLGVAETLVSQKVRRGYHLRPQESPGDIAVYPPRQVDRGEGGRGVLCRRARARARARGGRGRGGGREEMRPGRAGPFGWNAGTRVRHPETQEFHDGRGEDFPAHHGRVEGVLVVVLLLLRSSPHQIDQAFPPRDFVQFRNLGLQLGADQHEAVGGVGIAMTNATEASLRRDRGVASPQEKIDLVHVERVQRGLEGQQSHAPYGFRSDGIQRGRSGGASPLQRLSDHRQSLPLLPYARRLFQPPFDVRQVGQYQFQIDDLGVLDGIDPAVDVHDVRIVVTTHDVTYRVAFPHDGEETVAQSLPAGRATDESRDVDEFDGRGNASSIAPRRRRRHRGESREVRIGDRYGRDVRIDGAEGEIGRFGQIGSTGEGVEEGGFSDVR
mmetsp:Transcript_52890/g.158314  ORF Transcript_52890/g.158314 Transcript_52890/m.158314 type:complete len:528 (+) Transcript_52890:182-1765(+)